MAHVSIAPDQHLTFSLCVSLRMCGIRRPSDSAPFIISHLSLLRITPSTYPISPSLISHLHLMSHKLFNSRCAIPPPASCIRIFPSILINAVLCPVNLGHFPQPRPCPKFYFLYFFLFLFSSAKTPVCLHNKNIKPQGYPYLYPLLDSPSMSLTCPTNAPHSASCTHRLALAFTSPPSTFLYAFYARVSISSLSTPMPPSNTPCQP